MDIQQLAASYEAATREFLAIAESVPELKAHGIGELITKEFTSVWAILFQLVMIGSVVLLTRVNWKRFLPTKPSSS